MKKILLTLFVLSGFALNIFAQTEVYLSLTSASKRSDIGISNFSSSDGSQESVKSAKILKEAIENDLVLSRYFNIILGDPSAMLSFEEQLDKWYEKGAIILLKADVKATKDTVELDIRLYDVTSGEIIWKDLYKENISSQRKIAHNVSNEIIKRFSGAEGIAHSKIAFINNSTGHKEVYIIDYDGYNLKRLTRDNKINILPKWSPDGKSIIYTSYLYDNPDLFMLDLEKNKKTSVSKIQGLNTAAAFSPDGERIVLTLSRGAYPNLYLINKKGEIIRRMTSGHHIDTSPNFAPNGKEIVFISDRPGYPQLYIMNVDGGNVRRITTSGFCDSPAWSPRGDKIVFTMRQPKGNYDLYIYDLPTGNITRITRNKRNNVNPTWSPDGRFIVYASNRNGKYDLFIMAIDGSGTRKLVTMPGTSYTPSWSGAQVK